MDFHTHSRVSFQPINTRQQAVRMASCSWCSTQLGFPLDTSRTRPAASWEEQCRRAWAALSRSSSELTKLALSQAIPALRALRITAIIAAPLELWEGSVHCSHPMLLLCKRLAPFSNAEENKPRVCLLWSFFFFFGPQTTIWRLILKSTDQLLLAHCPSAQSYSMFPCSSSNNLLCTLCPALQAQPLQGSLWG